MHFNKTLTTTFSVCRLRWDEELILLHSSEIRGLCSTKSSSETLQNLLYFMYKKTHVVFSFFIFFYLMNALVYVDIDFGFLYMYIKYGKFWSVSLELFVEHKLWNWEECDLPLCYHVLSLFFWKMRLLSPKGHPFALWGQEGQSTNYSGSTLYLKLYMLFFCSIFEKN